MKLGWSRLTLGRVAAVVLVLAGVLVGTPVPAQAQYVSVSGRHVALQNFAVPWEKAAISGEDANYGSASGDYFTSGYNEWVIVDHPPGGHTIQEYYQPWRCLDSNYAGSAYGIPCNGGAYQHWHFNYTGTMTDSLYGRTWNAYEIVNVQTGRCLDSNGTDVYTLPCNGGLYQRWFFFEVDIY